jgi:hypothetical protein
MEEAGIGFNQTLMPSHQAAKVAKPGEGAFHNPPPLVTAQLAPILMGRLLIVTPCRDDRLDTAPFERLAQRITVVATISNEPVRTLARSPRLACPPDGHRVECLLQQLHFRRGSRVHECSQRSTRAIDQNHPLRALAALSLADFSAPFFAGAKLPSAKHSSQRIFWRSLSCAKKARHSSSKVPLSSHSRSLRQQVEGLPYWRGNSLHCAPVQRIHRMPSKQRRSSTRGRPPFALGFRWGRCGRIFSHCLSVTALHAMQTKNHKSLLLARRVLK